MEEVQDLLREAWQKAYDKGFVITDAQFRTVDTYCGNKKLRNVGVDGYLMEKTYD